MLAKYPQVYVWSGWRWQNDTHYYSRFYEQITSNDSELERIEAAEPKKKKKKSAYKENIKLWGCFFFVVWTTSFAKSKVYWKKSLKLQATDFFLYE